MFILLFVLFAFTANTQTINIARLDSIFENLDTYNRFMGSIAISHNNALVYQKSVGYGNISENIKSTENSKYRIGSISKTFTSTLIFMAVEENKLNLNQTIDRYFPEIPNASKITVGNLLNHRSGIFNFTNSPDYLTWHTEPKTEAELIDLISKSGSVFEPDSKAEYSNANYVLLAFILEKIYNQSYSEILTEKITGPLQLSNTYAGEEMNPEGGEVYSYKYMDQSWRMEPDTDMSIPKGAGNIISTPSDLTKFIYALFEGKLISSGSLNLITRITDNYGMGIFKTPFYAKTGYGHTGGIDGFSSVLVYYPDDKVAVAITSNALHANLNDILIGALSSFYNMPYKLPVFADFDINPAVFDQYLGVYASTQLPLKITITKNNDALIAQATGQPSFVLEASDKNTFRFDQAGIVIVFKPVDKQLILKQGGGEFLFSKE